MLDVLGGHSSELEAAEHMQISSLGVELHLYHDLPVHEPVLVG